jgi:hypothetical protein
MLIDVNKQRLRFAEGVAFYPAQPYRHTAIFVIIRLDN